MLWKCDKCGAEFELDEFPEEDFHVRIAELMMEWRFNFNKRFLNHKSL
jgi:hypothetical protein